MRTHKAFTLLELLVSIAIIAVLLGVTLPALRSARTRAGSELCKVHLRSIGAMYEMYASDHQGAWATLKYPRDNQGVADARHIPAWGASGGWFVLPINEITFWAYPLRDYATDNSEKNILQAVESLSCPVVFNRWLDTLGDDQLTGVIQDPTFSPQESYFHSVALFTSPSGWAGGPAAPDVNAIHARVKMSDVSHPSRKAVLVEKAAYHDRRESSLSAGASEQFNILAADGHVERRSADTAAPAAGFVGMYTGLETPPQSENQHEQSGIPYVSTNNGALGRDW